MDKNGILKSQIVQLILNLLVDGNKNFDGQFQYVIPSPDVIPLLFGLLPDVERSLQSEMLDAFIPFVGHSTLNK